MKTWKRISALLLCAVMLLGVVPVSAAAQPVDITVTETAPVVLATTASGNCGRNLTWKLSDAGVLTISGSGEMGDFDEYYDAPWYDYKSSIKTVKIGADVTSIEEGAFYNYDNLKKVTIGSGVREIGEAAFYDCDSLTTITIPAGVREIDEDAFANCGALKTIYFEGSAPEMEEDTFRGVTATCYYPANDSSWDRAKNRNYGGTLTWKTGSPDSSATVDKVPNVKASNVASSGKIKLTWNAVEGASEYKVYRSTSKNGNYKLMFTTSGTKYTNTSAKAGNYYYYYIVAVASDGTVSEKSNIVGRTCDLARPTIKLSNVASSGKVKITWEGVDGAVKYKVYRATSKNGDYSLMKTVTGTSMVNANGVAGRTYYYKVKAIAENTNANSAYSEIKSRTCDLPRPEASVKLNSNGKPVVTWAKVSGAEDYEVYIYNSNGDLLKTVDVDGTKMTHKKAVAGTTYKYRVVAEHDESSADSAKSVAVSIKAK